jgi:signal transduction histidine kinase
VFAAGFAFLMALGAFGLYLHLARSYHRDFDRGLVDAVRGARALFQTDRAEFGTAAATVAHVVTELVYGDRTLVAYDSSGLFLGASPRVPGEPWFADAPAAGPLNRPETVVLRDGPARIARIRLADDIRVVIAMDTLPLERRLARLKRALATVIPVILVLGAVLGAWGAGLVLKPIVHVAESAERIGQEVAGGATSFARLPAHTAGDEITTLTEAFNRLVDRLGTALTQERSVADRQRGFLADAAHELRTPVAILRSEAEVALKTDGDAGIYRQAMERIASEATELGTLVSDLLLVAREDGQALAPGQQKLYLDDLVNTAIQRARALPAARGREIRRGEFEAAPVSGDAALLERALLALLHNALIHAPDSPIEVSTGISGDGSSARSWVRVRDFGPGIPPAERERVFERFTRLNTAVPGSGLGLAIARSIAQAHGGRLTLDEVEAGTQFTLSLPRG